MMQPIFDRSGGLRYVSYLGPERTRTARGWRSVQAGALLLVIVFAMLEALSTDDDSLDAAAVMALTQASHSHGVDAAQRVTLDPHFMTLTPLGLELLGTRTRRLNALTHADEFDYRNAEGDTITLITALAPLEPDEPHWRARRIGNMRLLSWTHDGKRYILAGHASTRGLMRAADALTAP